jgi:nitrogen fixation NifU-like protein
MYSSELLDHFEHPRNAGEVQNADARVRVENPACGDILELAVESSEGRILEIRFRAKGCVPAMACASAVTELAKGKSFREALQIQKEDVNRAVGGVPPASGHAAQLAVDALRALLEAAKHE